MNRVNVAERVNRVGDVRDVFVLETAHDVSNGVDLADVFQKFVAEPFALRRALYQPGNVDEADGCGRSFFGAVKFRQDLKARIGHGDDADVRLNRAERIIRRLCARLRYRVKQRRLAHVRQTDDTDFKTAHEIFPPEIVFDNYIGKKFLRKESNPRPLIESEKIL